MKKELYTNLKSYTYNNEHKGAHYTFDSIHYMNAGEWCEAQYKYVLGLDAVKDANTPFDAGSDIETLHRSVKSSKATLTSEILGKDMSTSLNCYFERVASTSWAWVIPMDGTLTVYVMNANEFKEFTELWASYTNEGRIRYKATSGKMIKWFEEKTQFSLD